MSEDSWGKDWEAVGQNEIITETQMKSAETANLNWIQGRKWFKKNQQSLVEKIYLFEFYELWHVNSDI